MNIPQNFHQLYYNMNPDIQISLAKPNKQIIGNLSEAFNVSGNFKLGQINELSFSIPYSVENNFIQVRNKNVDKIKQRYLLKVAYLGIEEWFRIEEEKDDLNDTNIKHVTAYSLGYQLSDKYIRQWAGYKTTYVDNDGIVTEDYRKDSLNSEQVMGVILDGTSWKYNASKSDGIFLTRYRGFDFSGVNKLQAVITIAETMNAVIEWDTHSKEIIFHDIEKFGRFGGLSISDDNYLSSYEKTTKSDELATRLKLYGKDGLTINEINPIGTDYIEDLSYFLKGFNMDSDDNVLSHSLYVSDDLCKAILNYQKNAENKNGQFTSLLTQKIEMESDLKDKQSELFNLNNELTAIEIEIDLAESQKLDASNWKIQQTQKKAQISTKNSEITQITEGVDSIDLQLNVLKSEISIDNNFTPSQIDELDNFIVEKTWENNSISDVHELMELGRKELDKMNKPNSSYSIGLVYLLRIAEAQKALKKLKLGDRIKINKREINETVEAQLIEMNIDFDERNINLVIADFSNNKDIDELANLLYKNSIATTTINLNKSNWDDISSTKNTVNNLLNEKWNAAEREIMAGGNSEVTFNHRGITVASTNDSKMIRMTNGAIVLVDENGKVSLSMDGSGVYADALVGRILIGQELFLENEDKSFTFNNNGVSIKNTSFSLTSEEGGNGVSITTNKGIVIEKSDAKVRSTFNATDGILIETKKAGNWNKEFWYDPVGERLIVDGEINARELKVNGESVLTTNSRFINGLYVKNINADEITTGSLNAINIYGSKIETTEDVIVGDKLYLNSTNLQGEKGIIFRSDGESSAYIINETNGDFTMMGGVTIVSSLVNTKIGSLFGNVNLVSGFDGQVLIDNQVAATQNWVINQGYVNSARLNNYYTIGQTDYNLSLLQSQISGLLSRVSALEGQGS